jgi:ribonuclease P protein subunit POP4
VRNPRNILQHELIGLKCEVMSAPNKALAGIKGKIVDETLNTISIKTDDMIKRVPKRGCIFRMKIESQTVEVDGDYLISRPEDRIKRKFPKW